VKLLVGLGNPGAQYELTRHNIGFLVLDELALKHDIRISKKAYYSRYGEGKIAEENVLLLKPMTFMNLSGKAVCSLLKEGRFSLEDLLVVHDDIDLLPGTIRKKKRGEDAGHKGIRSIIESVGSGEFQRLRVGVGRPEGEEDVSDYLLRPIPRKEIPLFGKIVENSVLEIESIIETRKKKEKKGDKII
jgi:PTH1 family peptidyl-tRNA hydrolase